MTAVETLPAQAPPVTPLTRHIVEFDKATKEPKDKTLCGELWDRLGLKSNGPICSKCEEEFKRMAQRGEVWGGVA